MFSFIVTPESVMAIVGVIFSLLFSYFPLLRVWYAGLTPDVKSAVMIVLLIAVSIIVYILGCYQILMINIACTQSGAWELIATIIAALVANQTTWTATKNLPQFQDVIDAKVRSLPAPAK